MAVREFNGIFDILAVVLLANLFGFFLDECGEGLDVARNILARLFLGGDQRVVEALDLFALGLVDAVQREGLGRGSCTGRCCSGVAYAIDGMMLRLVFVFRDANSLH